VGYESLHDLHNSIGRRDSNLHTINTIDGEIKGSRAIGVEQSSFYGKKMIVELSDGEVFVNDAFIEFVWRHPKTANATTLNDFNNGFISDNANKIVETLFQAMKLS
jgi:hypothetical protein